MHSSPRMRHGGTIIYFICVYNDKLNGSIKATISAPFVCVHA